jgi:replication-associated recombination protein RarA
MSVLYAPSERMKIEWAIGAIVNGDSKKLQKFLVMYGAPGTGKSTVINIIQNKRRKKYRRVNRRRYL